MKMKAQCRSQFKQTNAIQRKARMINKIKNTSLYRWNRNGHRCKLRGHSVDRCGSPASKSEEKKKDNPSVSDWMTMKMQSAERVERKTSVRGHRLALTDLNRPKSFFSSRSLDFYPRSRRSRNDSNVNLHSIVNRTRGLGQKRRQVRVKSR